MSHDLEPIQKLAQAVLKEVEHFDIRLRHAPISAKTEEGYKKQQEFQQEGPVGYLVVKCGSGVNSYVLCRSGAPGVRGAGATYLNYKAPLGTLASLNVGESAMVPLRDHPILPPTLTEHVLVAKDIFRTQAQDAVRNVLSPPLPALNIPSLRDFLSGKFTLEEKRPRKRPAIEAISLRDQVVVDSQQDPLFRLPVAITVVISGSPGTGKTTVMIKRLAAKASRDNLVQSGEVGEAERLDHLFVADRNWSCSHPPNC